MLEQRLLLDRLEVQILGQRVDQIFIAHRGGDLRVADFRFARPGEHRLEAFSMAANHDLVVGMERQIGEGFHARAPVAATLVFFKNAHALETAQHDVVAPVCERFDVREESAAADRIHRRLARGA